MSSAEMTVNLLGTNTSHMYVDAHLLNEIMSDGEQGFSILFRNMCE